MYKCKGHKLSYKMGTIIIHTFKVKKMDLLSKKGTLSSTSKENLGGKSAESDILQE